MYNVPDFRADGQTKEGPKNRGIEFLEYSSSIPHPVLRLRVETTYTIACRKYTLSRLGTFELF